MANTFTPFGGRTAYIYSQQERYRRARERGDSGEMAALERDAQRVGFSLPTGYVTTTQVENPTNPEAPATPSSSGEGWKFDTLLGLGIVLVLFRAVVGFFKVR
jgi:hypothetical protein